MRGTGRQYRHTKCKVQSGATMWPPFRWKSAMAASQSWSERVGKHKYEPKDWPQARAECTSRYEAASDHRSDGHTNKSALADDLELARPRRAKHRVTQAEPAHWSLVLICK